MVFTIVWILLLENWVNTAAILAITMRMIHLCLAGLQEAAAQFWNAIGGAHVHVECVELVRFVRVETPHDPRAFRRSVDELVKAIWEYLTERNLKPTRYEWKADGKAILAKIQRAEKALAQNSQINKDNNVTLH